jgi:hypothetical protein
MAQTTKIIDRKALPFKIKYVTLGLTEIGCKHHTITISPRTGLIDDAARR